MAQVTEAQNKFKTTQLPLLDQLAGPDPAAYSNEADAFESNFQSVFYGSNYERLKKIKRTYDPTGLFIVRAGVGSEDWDIAGACRKA